MNDESLTTAVRSSSLCELGWVAAGQLHVRGAVALLRGGRVAFPFTYADAEVARSVAAADQVAVALTEQRSTGAGFRPLLLRGRPWLVEDPSGEVFTEDLLTQELHRFPPSRLYADSPLLRREHWWYLPRLVVEVDVESMEPIEVRTTPEDHLLVVQHDGHLVVRVARLAGQTSGTVVLDVPGDPAPGPALLFGQDASFPDLEQWAQWSYRGHWDGTGFRADEVPERTGLGPPASVWQRWRRQRLLEKRCRAAIPK